MLKCMMVLLLSLCTLCGAAVAVQPPDAKAQAKEQKARQKAQKKKIREEVRYYESLRNDAVIQFAKANQPSEIRTPMLRNDIRITNVICAGDNISGTVVVHMDVTPLFGAFRLFMGGEQNGTRAYAKGVTYPSVETYGRVYTLRAGQPERVTVMFRNIAPGVNRLDRVDISMGLALNALNVITLRDVPIFWTYTNRAISNYIKDNQTTNSEK